jgi:hypothetical protein
MPGPIQQQRCERVPVKPGSKAGLATQWDCPSVPDRCQAAGPGDIAGVAGYQVEGRDYQPMRMQAGG